MLQVDAGEITESEIINRFGSGVLVEGGGFNCRHKWERAARSGSKFYQPKDANNVIKEKDIKYNKGLFFGDTNVR